jgi:hypothetical protein
MQAKHQQSITTRHPSLPNKRMKIKLPVPPNRGLIGTGYRKKRKPYSERPVLPKKPVLIMKNGLFSDSIA